MINNQDKPLKLDWKAVVAANKPGTETPLQSARLQLFLKLKKDLVEWSAKYKLLERRVEVSAYSGSFMVPVEAPYLEALTIARYCIWVFDLDEYIDYYIERFETENSAAKRPLEDWLPALDAQLMYVFSPLCEIANVPLEKLPAYKLGFLPDFQSEGLEVEERAANLRASLMEMYEDFANYFHTSPQELGFSKWNFIIQTLLMAGAMREEQYQNFRYRQNPTPSNIPSMEAYLANSKFTIAYICVAAAAVGFEENPDQIWKLFEPAVESAAIATRLANDLGNYWTELKERKINSITVSLQQLGYDPMGLYNEQSFEVEQARQIAAKRLAQEISRFEELWVGLPTGIMFTYLENMTSFGLEMYSRGNYIAP